MRARWAALALSALGIGCEVDVQLGVRPSAAALDSGLARIDGGEVTPPEDLEIDAGARDVGAADTGVLGTPHFIALGFSDARNGVSCIESLAGRESEFLGFTAASFGLHEGTVGLEDVGDTLRIRGAPIRDAYGVDELALRQGAFPDQPAESYIGLATGSRAPGPGDTRLTTALLLVDSRASLTGVAGFEFTHPTIDGACLLSFGVTLTPE